MTSFLRLSLQITGKSTVLKERKEKLIGTVLSETKCHMLKAEQNDSIQKWLISVEPGGLDLLLLSHIAFWACLKCNVQYPLQPYLGKLKPPTEDSAVTVAIEHRVVKLWVSTLHSSFIVDRRGPKKTCTVFSFLLNQKDTATKIAVLLGDQHNIVHTVLAVDCKAWKPASNPTSQGCYPRRSLELYILPWASRVCTLRAVILRCSSCTPAQGTIYIPEAHDMTYIHTWCIYSDFWWFN